MASVFTSDGQGGWIISNTTETGKIEITTTGEIKFTGRDDNNNVIDYSLQTIKTDIEQLTAADQNFETRIAKLEQACLRYDTQILMADNTTKNICDIKYGDMVKGWDVDNNCTIDIKAYGAIKTGVAKDWTYFVFEDGKTLEIYKTHGIYSKTHNEIRASRSWGYGDLGISDQGQPIAYCFTQTIQETHFDDRYVLVTANDTYFANGILCGMAPQTKMRYYAMKDPEFNKNITAQDLEFFKLTADYFENNITKKVRYRSFFAEAGSVYTQINIAKRKIREYKAEIAAQDYKTIKYTQGKLTEEEFYEYSIWAQNLRNLINEQETLVETLEEVIKQLKITHNVDQTNISWKTLYDMNMEYIRTHN